MNALVVPCGGEIVRADMDDHRHAGLDGQIGKDPRMEDEDHVWIEAIDRLRDRLPGRLANETKERGGDRGARVEERLGGAVADGPGKLSVGRGDVAEMNAVEAGRGRLERRNRGRPAGQHLDPLREEPVAAAEHPAVGRVATPMVDKEQPHTGRRL